MNYSFSEIIEKKKHSIELSAEEIKWLINSYVKNNVTDYQMAAFAMAVYFNGMTKAETLALTQSYVESGYVYDVSEVTGLKADKHSTGGVGDKTSLVYSPLVASYGVKVCKLSGRGLGVTGGTIDKLESCKGWTSELSKEKFIKTINEVGMSITGQSDDIVPADKKMYALRDVTGTVDSIPLIAASIMSKKLVIDSDSLILDVKVGAGAFMKNVDIAEKLANEMITIGHGYNRKVSILLTDMQKPLGKAIGNAIEVKEAWDTLNNNGPEDLKEVVCTAAGLTLTDLGIFDKLEDAITDCYKKLETGECAHFLEEFVEAQGGNFELIKNYDQNFTTKNKIEVIAEKDGYIISQDAETIGLLSMDLGAGRKTKEDLIDFSAGIYLNKKTGDVVKTGDVILTFYTNLDINNDWIERAKKSFIISTENEKQQNIIKIIR
ncbi:thymidine phosphorylase [Mesoplasma florum]|uniref:thymidine phosphorylase n=1 Tax=Mesoplasma florum TaxID=2151 RepID=UPI000D08A61D|nr:thymidine phosphorylase [Mesoplasma florum]AVN64864.1 thymidine phosphorylase [Mesoplasma florum]